MTDTRTLKLRQAAGIRSRRQRWLWADRIPLGTVTIFAGRGGEGKSTFALHVASQVNRGSLEGDLHGESGAVLIVSHEDDWSTVMKPRFIGAGADTALVYQLAIETVQDEVTFETVPALPLDVERIRQAVQQTGARLIIVDPITSTMAGDLHKVADVRSALDPLARLAQDEDIAVIAIAHFAKGSGNVSDKLSGSHAFRDASRAVLLFATDEDTEQRVVSLDKSNYSASRGSSFAFALLSVVVDTDDGSSTSVARVQYLGDSDVSVSDIVNRDPSGAASDDRNEAQTFVVDYLMTSDGWEAKAGDVIKAGRAAGFSESEVKHARRRCRDPKIASVKAAFRGDVGGTPWVWRIEGATEGAEGSKGPNPGTFDPDLAPSTAGEQP